MSAFPMCGRVPLLLGHIESAENIAAEIAKACRGAGYNRHALEFTRLRCQLAEADCLIATAELLESEGTP